MFKELIKKEIWSLVFLFMYVAFIIARYTTDSLYDTTTNIFLTIALLCGILWEVKDILLQYRKLKMKE